MTGRTIVGVDLAASGLRAVVCGGIDEHGYIRVTRAVELGWSAETVTAGRITNPVTVARRLTEAARELKVRHPLWVPVVGKVETELHPTTVPVGARPSEWPVAVRTTGIDSPMDLSAARISVSPTPWEPRDGRRPVVVAVTRLHEVDVLERLFRLVPGELRAVDTHASALVRALVREPAHSRVPAAIVDIGATATVICIREGQVPVSLHASPLGGETITRAIMSVTGWDRPEAVSHQRVLAVPTGDRPAEVVATSYVTDTDTAGPMTRLEEAVSREVDNLVSEIGARLIAESRRDHRSGLEVTTLVGGVATMGGLRERLEDHAGVRCLPGLAWARPADKGALRSFSAHEDPEQILARLALAVGAATWRVPR